MPGSRRHGVVDSSPTVVAGFVAAYVALGFVGRWTIAEGTTFALIWPAGGLAVLWFLLRGAGPRSVDTVLLAVATYAVNVVTGAPYDIGLLLVVTNVAQTLAAVGLVRRYCPELWGAGGDRPLDSPGVLVRFLATAVVATGLGAALGAAGTSLLHGGLDGTGAVLWLGRNLCGVLMVVPVGLLVARLRSVPSDEPVVGPAGRLELATAGAFTIAMYALAFTFDDLPLAFPLVAGVVWVGMRYTTVVSAAYATLNGIATIRLTLNHIGPFAAVEDPQVGALLAQFYIVTIVVTGLSLSTGLDERRRLEAEVRRNEEEAVYQAELLNSVITSMTEGLTVIDDTGAFLMRNPAASEAMGNGPDGPLPGLPSLAGTFADGSPIPEGQRPSQRALRGETVRNVEVLFDDEGQGRVLTVSAIPLPRDEDQDRARAMLLFHDVTDDYRRREDLTNFAGVVAHDLRNPLAAIDGWTELIGDEIAAGEFDPTLLRDFVDRVRSSAGRMGELVRDLLAYATSNAADLDLGRVDLAPIVRDVAASREVEGLVTVRDLPPVHADPVLVRQLLDNLIGNAVKYVAPGVEPKIEVSGRVEDGRVVTAVSDNGIGVPAGEHEKVFTEFHRASTGAYEGTGLGLAICRRIVTRLGGSIVARDNPGGQGTVFEFTLPSSGSD